MPTPNFVKANLGSDAEELHVGLLSSVWGNQNLVIKKSNYGNSNAVLLDYWSYNELGRLEIPAPKVVKMMTAGLDRWLLMSRVLGRPLSDLKINEGLEKQIAIWVGKIHLQVPTERGYGSLNWIANEGRPIGVYDSWGEFLRWKLFESIETCHDRNFLDPSLASELRFLFRGKFSKFFSGNPGHKSLLNGDFHAGHFFVNPLSSKLNGIIDFGNALFGDALYDIAYLSISTPSLFKSKVFVKQWQKITGFEYLSEVIAGYRLIISLKLASKRLDIGASDKTFERLHSVIVETVSQYAKIFKPSTFSISHSVYCPTVTVIKRNRLELLSKLKTKVALKKTQRKKFTQLARYLDLIATRAEMTPVEFADRIFTLKKMTRDEVGRIGDEETRELFTQLNNIELRNNFTNSFLGSKDFGVFPLGEGAKPYDPGQTGNLGYAVGLTKKAFLWESPHILFSAGFRDCQPKHVHTDSTENGLTLVPCRVFTYRPRSRKYSFRTMESGSFATISSGLSHYIDYTGTIAKNFYGLKGLTVKLPISAIDRHGLSSIGEAEKFHQSCDRAEFRLTKRLVKEKGVMIKWSFLTTPSDGGVALAFASVVSGKIVTIGDMPFRDPNTLLGTILLGGEFSILSESANAFTKKNDLDCSIVYSDKQVLKIQPKSGRGELVVIACLPYDLKKLPSASVISSSIKVENSKE